MSEYKRSLIPELSKWKIEMMKKPSIFNKASKGIQKNLMMFCLKNIMK